MNICPHTIRVIEDWASKKVINKATKSSTGYSRGGGNFGIEFPGPGEKSLRYRNGSNKTVGKSGAKRVHGTMTPNPHVDHDDLDSPSGGINHDS